MNRRRVVGGALALTLAGATAFGMPTQASASGTGSSTIAASLLSIQLGEGGALLGVDLIAEEATTINGDAAAASARLHTASLSSETVEALNAAGPSYEVASSSSADTQSAPAVDLASPAGHALPLGVVSGRVVPQPLSAGVDAAGAHTSGGAALEGLSLAGGLVSAARVETTIGSDSIATGSSAPHTVRAENVRVLDLGALLAGLGIDPTQLSIDTLSKLIASLDLEVAGVDVGETLAGVVNETSGQIDTLTGLLPSTGVASQQVGEIVDVPGTGVEPVDTVVDTVDESLGQVPVPDVPLDTTVVTDALPDELQALLGEGATVEDVLALIETLQEKLAGVLGESLKSLDAAPLLTIDSIEITVASKAADTVEASLADVSAKVSGVRVGELGSLGAIDLTDLTAPTSIAQVDALIAKVELEVGKVLGEVDPGLTGIVNIALFDDSESVSAEGTTVKSLAGLTALTATVTPPSDLAGIIDGILAKVGLADLLAEAGLTVPTVAEAMTQLNGLLDGVTASGVSAQQVPDIGALAQGVTVSLGALTANSTFTPTPASVPTPAAPSVPTAEPPAPGAPTELPRTGSSLTYMLLAVAALLIATGLGLPQWAEATMNTRGSRRTN